MNKLTTTLLITALAIGGLALSGTGMARQGDGYSSCDAHGMQGKSHGHRHKEGYRHAGRGLHAMLRLEKSLALSEEQRAAVREIMRDARTARHAHRDKLIDARLALHDLMDAENFNEQEARRLVGIQADNMAELMLLHARTRAGIRAQLTAEQREKLSGLKSDHGPGDRSGRPW